MIDLNGKRLRVRIFNNVIFRKILEIDDKISMKSSPESFLVDNFFLFFS